MQWGKCLWGEMCIRSSVSTSMQIYVLYVCLRIDLNENSADMHWGGNRIAYTMCVQGIISKMVLRWRGETERRRDVGKKSRYFYFLCIQKVFSSLHNITIDPLMADGVSWQCFSCFSGPWQYKLLGSQWDGHKTPSFHRNYLKLCSEDKLKLLRVWNDMGVKWIMTKKIFWGGVTRGGTKSLSQVSLKSLHASLKSSPKSRQKSPKSSPESVQASPSQVASPQL